MHVSIYLRFSGGRLETALHNQLLLRILEASKLGIFTARLYFSLNGTLAIIIKYLKLPHKAQLTLKD